MVRHTGFLSLVMMAGLALGTALHRDDSIARVVNAHASSARPTDVDAQHALRRVQGKVAPTERTKTVLRGLPRNSLITIGSLDTSGAPHDLVISFEPLAPISSPDFTSRPATARQMASGSRSPRPRPHDSSPLPIHNGLLCDSFTETSPLSATSLSATSLSATSPSATSLSATSLSENATANYLADAAEKSMNIKTIGSAAVVAQFRLVPSANRTTRHFRTPRFETSGTFREVVPCILIAQSARVAIFVDSGLLEEPCSDSIDWSKEHAAAAAEEICLVLEFHVLPLVERMIGPIEDVDSNGRLAIVISDLERRQNLTAPPVRGCVHDRDFLHHESDDFFGDIVYLDDRLPRRTELTSLLAHELTHAAILSAQVRSQTKSGGSSRQIQVAPWLNEAAAHWVEHRVSRCVPGFNERLLAFREQSSHSPIVASDSYLTFARRRSGSRAAGLLFLETVLQSPECLREFVLTNETLEQRVELATGRPFRNVFRDWMRHIAPSLKPEILTVADLNVASGSATIPVIRRSIYGTALLQIQLPDGAETFSITHDEFAELEFEVTKQPFQTVEADN